MFLLAAISLGFLGSFHCVGMCGPIALALPVKRTSQWNVIAGSLIYNTGRIITYAMMGFVFGFLGKGVVFAGLQNVVSITLGVVILTFILIPRLSFTPRFTQLIRLLTRLKDEIRRLFGIHSSRSLLMIGILNGFLPCGLVYLGITGSIATGDAFDGALFMAGFGLGTFPAMMTVTLIKDFISIGFREKIRKAVPVFACVMAVMLILRGMNLGIPYLSPGVTVEHGVIIQDCCKK